MVFLYKMRYSGENLIIYPANLDWAEVRSSLHTRGEVFRDIPRINIFSFPEFFPDH